MSTICLLAGTQKGGFIISSDERRETWNVSQPIIRGWSVSDIAHDPRTPGTLYAAANHFIYGTSLHVSRDFGHTWQQVEKPPRYPEGSSFKMNSIWTVVPGRETEPGVVYAGVDEAGLFVSRDSGQSWEEMTSLTSHPSRGEWCPGGGGLCCHTVLLDPGNKNRMWVGISAVGVFRTDDGGATWSPANNGLEIIIAGEKHKDIGTCVHRVVLDPRNPDRLFQQNHRGLFRSTDGGANWERIENGIPNKFGFPMVMLPNDPNTLFIVPQESDEFRFAADGKPAVYRTTDGGGSWHALRKGLPDDAYIGVMRHAMTADACASPGVYFGTSSGQIFYSRDGGENWQAIPCILPRINSLNVMRREA